MASWCDELQSGSHSQIFRRYLELTLICAVDRRPERFERLDALVPSLMDSPLLQYRVGSCDDRYQSRLHDLRMRVPKFVDADYALGPYALRDREAPDQDEAMRRFRSAAAAFPSSTSIPTATGNLYPELGRLAQCAGGLRSSAGAAAVASGCPSRPHHQPVATRASSGCDCGSDTAYRRGPMAPRAGVLLACLELLQHRAERRGARRADRTPEADGESGGVSAFRDDRVALPAPRAGRANFEALKMDFGQCDAAFYLGGVRAELRKLPEALAAMSQARQCYDLTLSVQRKLLVESQARAGTLEQKAREAARHERSIANVEKRRAEVLEAIDRLQKIQAAAVPLAPTSRQSPRVR